MNPAGFLRAGHGRQKHGSGLRMFPGEESEDEVDDAQRGRVGVKFASFVWRKIKEAVGDIIG